MVDLCLIDFDLVTLSYEQRSKQNPIVFFCVVIDEILLASEFRESILIKKVKRNTIPLIQRFHHAIVQIWMMVYVLMDFNLSDRK